MKILFPPAKMDKRTHRKAKHQFSNVAAHENLDYKSAVSHGSKVLFIFFFVYEDLKG